MANIKTEVLIDREPAAREYGEMFSEWLADYATFKLQDVPDESYFNARDALVDPFPQFEVKALASYRVFWCNDSEAVHTVYEADPRVCYLARTIAEQNGKTAGCILAVVKR